MNLASWIILGIVVALVALAIRATFFKRSKRSCCDVGDKHAGRSRNADDASCAACSSCSSCPVAQNALMPTIRYEESPAPDKE